MLQELFEEQRSLLNRFFDRMDFASFEKVFEKALACKGIVIFSGVGKSGHIAEKIATTFSSTGTRSIFLSPASALHGDIGFVTSEDLFISLSKSGESQELLELIPHIQNRKTFCISCVSNSHSRLAQKSDLTLVLPVEKEVCPYDLAPTTSTAAQLIFGDCLAIALMRAKGFTQSDFTANHPAGFLGRKTILKVRDLMLKDSALPFCLSDQKLIEVLHDLSSKRCGCLLVIDEQKKLLGIFTDGDLRRSLESQGSSVLQTPMKFLMNPEPRWITSDLLAFEAMREMEKKPSSPFTVLPVLEKGKVIGLIRMHDILQAGLH